MIILVGVFLSIVTGINALLIYYWYSRFNTYSKAVLKTPKVSILVAARNEERNIASCIRALSNQVYPSSEMEILVGDDMSTDNTADIARQFPQVRLVSITENIGKARGKANVLAQLARKARGELFLITDADMAPNPEWVRTMVQYAAPSVGIINGITGIKNNLFQHYEWLFAQGMLKVITDISLPLTAIGNNMMVSRKAYESVGGFENLEFSITEDLALFKAISKNKFELRHVIEPGAYAESISPGSLKLLLQQRKRWMRGAVQLPFPVVLFLALQGLFYPLVVIGLYLDPQLTLSIFVVKIILQSFFIKAIADKAGLRLKGGLILYEFYSGFISMLTMVYYIIPTKITWKGRKY